MKKLVAVLVLGYALVSYIGTAEAAMTYEEAIAYQKAHAEDIVLRTEKIRNPYGEKSKCHYFSFLGKHGVTHSWGSLGDHNTLINFVVSYGDANMKEKPCAYFRWQANLSGNSKDSFAPDYLSVSFKDGYIQNIPLQDWEYNEQEVYVPGAYYGNGNYGYYIPGTSYSYNRYEGSVKVGALELYEMGQHGELASIFIDRGENDDQGNNNIRHFFYTGDKDRDKKAQLVRGFQHAITMLEIDAAHLQQLREEAEQKRVAKLKKEIEAELEKEALKQQILQEREAAGK